MNKQPTPSSESQPSDKIWAYSATGAPIYEEPGANKRQPLKDQNQEPTSTSTTGARRILQTQS